MTALLDRQAAIESAIARAETIAEGLARGPVERVEISQWVRSDREPGRKLSDPRMYAIYYNLPEDPKNARKRMAPICLMLNADELRALQAD